MAVTVPVTFKASPLPLNFSGTPQTFLDAMVARLSIEATANIAFYTTGSVAPASNTGAWLKNGITWYVWDTGTGAYVPETLEFQSLKYIAQAAAPDPTKYTFWIVLDGGGVAQSIKYYSGGSWNDVYASTFANIYTKAQTDAAITVAIAANPVAAGLNSFKATPSVGQAIVFAAPGTTTATIVLGTELYDSSSVFAANTFIAPTAGVYTFKGSARFDCTAGAPTGNSMSIAVSVNGAALAGDLNSDSSVNGRNLTCTSDVKLNAGDSVTLVASVTITGASGTWTIGTGEGQTAFSGFRVN